MTTEPLITELTRVLSREKFAQKVADRKLTVEAIVRNYRASTVTVEPAEIPLDVVRHPKDRAVLACAVGGSTDYMVSGDKDLLVLDIYDNIPILNAAQFLQRLLKP